MGKRRWEGCWKLVKRGEIQCNSIRCYQLSSRVERWHLNWLFPGHKLFNKVVGRKKIPQSGALAASLHSKIQFQ